jgi:Nucleotidyl transferase AbiEii toxin, Type IV TA system
MKSHVVSALAWERMVTAVEKVRRRLRRAAEALEQAEISYALAGGNAIAVWVSEVDESAVRNTQDVDILLRRDDLDRAKTAFAAAGFIYRHSSGIDMFLDGPGAKARDAVHIIFAGEKVRDDHLLPAPQVDESAPTPTCNVLNLEALVRMKLTSFRDKDRTHLRDLIDVGLIDGTWPARLPTQLGTRLQDLLDNPDG